MSLRAVPDPKVRVVVAEGQALVRAGFRVLLEDDPRIAVVGEAAAGEQAITVAARLRPDVVLLDVALPGLDSVAVTRGILSLPGVAVMLLTGSDSDDRIFAALRAGACGLLLKDTDPEELVRAVDLVARGEALLSPRLTRRLIAEFVSQPDPVRPRPEQLEELTEREREVMALAARGLNNAEIAGHLVVSPATAKTHIRRAMMKLRARDRAQLVALAYESGLVLARS